MHEVTDGDRVARLQAAILRYLADHPQAADTVRGIGRYWVPAADTAAAKAPTIDLVQRALDELVARRRIACVMLADGTRVYASAGSSRRTRAVRPKRANPK